MSPRFSSAPPPPTSSSSSRLSTGNAYVAVLQKYARKATFASHLSSISLANILSGETCSPIGLSDFEAYLAFQEHSLENLQFVVWFQDYRERFFALPKEVQAASPGPSEFNFGLPTPARTAQRVANSKRRTDFMLNFPSVKPPRAECTFAGPAALPKVASACTSQRRCDASTSAPVADVRTSRWFAEELRFAALHEQPFRDECERVVATFLRPGAAKELPLDPALRDAVVRDLTWNTHPETFQPAYEELCDILETTSVPRFLAGAAANINLPKQLFWYAVGAANTLAAALVAAVPAPPQTKTSRTWRLLAVPFATLGAMQLYTAWRGFCSDVFGRGGTQLRVWELAEMDEPAAAHWRRVLGDGSEDAPPAATAERTRTLGRDPEKAAARAGAPADVGAIAPFAAASHRRVGAGADTGGAHGARPFRRPPVFGPERVVLDPRILAAHRQVMRDMLVVGTVVTVAFTALVLSVPAVRH